MNHKITESTYVGYNELYSHKKDLPYLVVLFVLLDVLAIISLTPMNIPLTLTNIIFDLLIQILLLAAGGTILYDHKKKTLLLKQKYPYIDIKMSVRELKKNLKEYQLVDEETIEAVKSRVKEYEKIKEEVMNESIHNYSSLKYNKIPEEELEGVKVKVKTLARNRR